MSQISIIDSSISKEAQQYKKLIKIKRHVLYGSYRIDAYQFWEFI